MQLLTYQLTGFKILYITAVEIYCTFLLGAVASAVPRPKSAGQLSQPGSREAAPAGRLH